MKGWVISIGSVILFLVVIGLFRGCQTVGELEPVTYLVPKEYTGPIHVVYGVKTGSAPEYSDGRRVYRVPKDGVLLTQMPVNEGWVKEDSRRFFYVTDEGERTPIKEAQTWDEVKNSSNEAVYVLEGSLGSINGGSELPCEVSYQRYGIGTKSDHKEMEMSLRLPEYLQAEGVDCSSIRGGSSS